MRAVDLIAEQVESKDYQLVAKSGNQWIWKISEATYNDIKNKYKVILQRKQAN